MLQLLMLSWASSPGLLRSKLSGTRWGIRQQHEEEGREAREDVAGLVGRVEEGQAHLRSSSQAVTDMGQTSAC